MEDKDLHIKTLQAEIDRLNDQLLEASGIVEAIREGAVDALVLNNDGTPQVYSLESADYTYRILIEKFSESALSISEDGLILYCNDAFSKLTGIPSSDIVGTFFNRFIDGKEEPHLEKTMAEGSSKGEMMLQLPERAIPVSISFTNLQPNVSAIGVIVTDLTEKKKHEADLLKQKRQLELKVVELNTTNGNLEQFIHVISHDLKEPLRKILMHTSRMEATKPSAVTGKSDPVDVIKNSAIRLNSLVDDLVKYSFTSIMDEMTEIDLNAVLQEVKDDLELVITENNAVIESDKLPNITGSNVQMRQLFSNLLANAIKYRQKEQSPEIRISWETISDPFYERDEKKFYRISLSDNGIGMDKQHSGKIFTIFQRLHMRNEYSGNGIGLAICKKIMENHSGGIEVDSAPGKGSTFYLYFPKEEPDNDRTE